MSTLQKYYIIFLCLGAILGTTSFILIITRGKESFHGNKQVAYRLGDMIKSQDFREAAYGYSAHKANYPNSIATMYMESISKLSAATQDNNIQVLSSIIMSPRFVKYKNSSTVIVIHCRTGDVIDQQPYTVDEFLSADRRLRPADKYYYVKSLSYYKSILSEIQKIPSLPKKITIVTGFHTGGRHTKSLKYIKRIVDFFKSNGFDVATRINKPADSDFVYCATAKYFVQSGGGFSRIIASLVKSRGNHVIGGAPSTD
jgi:hypothetical protein